MIKKITIKPISVNQVWQGRRFKTPLYKRYEQDLLLLLGRNEKITGFVTVTYQIYLKYYATSDVDNFSKPLTDIIVKSGIIEDDRFIKKMVLEKFTSKEDYLIIEIKKYE